MYDYKYTVNDELVCLRDDKNIHRDNAIEDLSKVEEKKKKGCIVKPVEKLVGHVPEALAKIFVSTDERVAVDKWITGIENVFSGMICCKGHNQMLVFQQQ